MKIGIDASNIRAGGGLTYLIKLLQHARPAKAGVDEVFVWSNQRTLKYLPNHSWLIKLHHPYLDRSLVYRQFWQRFILGNWLIKQQVDVLFVPGGTYLGKFHPYVVLSQNMLPFDAIERKRYGYSKARLRLHVLKFIQQRTFIDSDGIIFLSEFARKTILQAIGNYPGPVRIIPHGIDKNFLLAPRPTKHILDYSVNNPFRILYVSIINEYKHQWHVATAVARLRQLNYPVSIEFVGPAYPPSLRRLKRTLRLVDPGQKFIHYSGPVNHEQLPGLYHQADMFVFAPSCENLPIILLEAMSAGLPIVCSNRGPMPEVLGNAGVYFDPEKADEIATAIQTLLEDAELREKKAWLAYKRALTFSWERCASETFDFIATVARKVSSF